MSWWTCSLGANRLQPAPLGEVATWMETVGAQWDRRLAKLQGTLVRGD
ncbi:MAG TPA: hypothetical protein VHH72_01175 [Solirubrobacterales bacterium]|jgi:hypothetical protein|nr:hypothetical protein [Solirubrobacterales bacterium]